MAGAAHLIDVEKLHEQTAEIIRRVEEGNEIIDVSDSGRIVARLIPMPSVASDSTAEAHEDIWRERRELARKIGEHWNDDLSAVEAVAEVRRDL